MERSIGKHYYDILRNDPVKWAKYKKWMNSHRQVRRLRVLNYYSKGLLCCNCCGEKELKFLQVDHINNDGYIHRKKTQQSNIENYILKNNFPEGFQILCANCNWGKRINNGVCPHQENKVMVNST